MASQLPALLREFQSIHDSIVYAEEACAANLMSIPERQRASALNPVHYMARRCHGLRRAQMELASPGLSSLGRTESPVRESVETVLRVLPTLHGGRCDVGLSPTALTVESGDALLTAHTDALLGPAPDVRTVRIMVTMPAEAADDYILVRDLLAGGMNCMIRSMAAVWRHKITISRHPASRTQTSLRFMRPSAQARATATFTTEYRRPNTFLVNA